MNLQNKCIIDNWSLQHAGFLLDNSIDIQIPEKVSFENSLGGLSNYINATLLYEKPSFLQNGFEHHWTQFPWFKQNTNRFFSPLDPSIFKIDWESEASYKDSGINNYLITSEAFNADLIISPERSSKILKIPNPTVSNNLITTLKQIDKGIREKKEESWFDNVKIGIDNNFLLPSLTQYVLSEASNQGDLLTVIMQLKSDGKIDRIKDRIDDITSSTKGSTRFQKEIEEIVLDSFGMKSNRNKPWAIKISVMFLTLSKSFNLDFFDRREHIVFLKNIAALRAENNSLKADIERIFNRKIN
ncbi:MAG: hypothetical protein H6581_02620 [Bacteroidia bacterium]|nr:hypothetical protein [Bacteroidia bacterium]